jgi:shikimate 5-dehydrogenase
MTKTFLPGDVLTPAKVPTMYFIGVTTAKSSIRPVFTLWADILNRPEFELVGIDLPLRADPDLYRNVVEFIKKDPLSRGALVTTHKVQLYRACQDLFDNIDPVAQALHEVSCLSKEGLALRATAKDPSTSVLALQSILPDTYWESHDTDVVCLGAGGSALALASHFVGNLTSKSAPRRIVVTNRSAERLKEFRTTYESLGSGPELELIHSPNPEVNDEVVSAAPPGSLVVNATGLGKDAPGSPLTKASQFPQDGYVWDFNYRGDLLFLDQARAQQAKKNLHIDDGWVYFLHGWTQAISEVLRVTIAPTGPLFDTLSSAARVVR